MEEDRRRELLSRLAALSVGGYVAPTVALLYPRDAFAVGSPCIIKFVSLSNDAYFCRREYRPIGPLEVIFVVFIVLHNCLNSPFTPPLGHVYDKIPICAA